VQQVWNVLQNVMPRQSVLLVWSYSVLSVWSVLLVCGVLPI
jgi:hypothetical protein